jgi:hypothetical protein
MNELLQRAYDALQQADAAGNAEDAQKLADYIRELEAQGMVQEEKKAAPADDRGLHNPMTYGLAGAAAGRLLGPAVGAGIDTAARSMMGRKPPVPGTAPAAPDAPRVEPSMAPPQPTRLSEPPPAVGQGAMKNVAHNVEEVLANRPAMSLTKQPEPGFEARPGRLIATPIGADLSTEAPPPPTRSAAQLSAPPAATPPAAPPKPSMLSRMSRNLAEPKKTPLYLGGAMAAGQGRDAYEQAREGNIGQAAMSGAGAVGGLGMLSRIKPIRAAGTLMGLGVPLTRMYKSLTEDEEKEKVERRAAGGLAGYAKGKMVKEIAAGKTPQALEDVLKFFKPKESKQLKLSEALAPFEGGKLRVTQADRMRVGEGMKGGPGFPGLQLTDPEHYNRNAAWMVDAKNAGTILSRAAKENPKTVFSNVLAKPTAHHSNRQVFGDLQDEYFKMLDRGEVSPEWVEKANLLIPKLTVGKEKKPMFSQPFDVRDKFAVQELADTFDRRGAMASMFAGERTGGAKGALPFYSKIVESYTDPLTKDAPTHAIGNRLFTLTGDAPEYTDDLHGAYNWLLKGKDQGVHFDPVPHEMAMKDFYSQMMKEKGRKPSTFDYTRGYPRSQDITEDYLSTLQRENMKEGGRTAAWQRKEGKNPEGGLNAKGRASYHAETGGTLKRPQPEGGARRDSFCSRMKGMKKKLTSAETANDPDSRINKALRKWKC